MLIEEDVKPVGEVNPDALEAVFEEEILIEEDVVIYSKGHNDDEDADEIDIAFQANDEEYW